MARGGSQDFPRCGLKRAAHRKTIAVSNGTAIVVFDGLATGSNTVLALHDKDGDGRMGRALLTPLERLAVSQVDRLGMTLPDFHSAAFDLESARKITLRVHYWQQQALKTHPPPPVGRHPSNDAADRWQPENTGTPATKCG